MGPQRKRRLAHTPQPCTASFATQRHPRQNNGLVTPGHTKLSGHAKTARSVARNHPPLQVLQLDSEMQALAGQLRDAQSLLFFARGNNYATALEAALKVCARVCVLCVCVCVCVCVVCVWCVCARAYTRALGLATNHRPSLGLPTKPPHPSLGLAPKRCPSSTPRARADEGGGADPL